MVEHLADKPTGESDEQWLTDVKTTTNVNPRVSEEWITLAGARALKVVNRNSDSTESENIYVLDGAKTFAIRASRNTPSYSVYERMLATFKFSLR